MIYTSLPFEAYPGHDVFMSDQLWNSKPIIMLLHPLLPARDLVESKLTLSSLFTQVIRIMLARGRFRWSSRLGDPSDSLTDNICMRMILPNWTYNGYVHNA